MSRGSGSVKAEREDSRSRRERPERPVAHIDQTRCDRAPGCPVSRVCPKEAVVPDTSAQPTTERSFFGLLSREGRPAWKVDEDKCTGCLLCARYCPHQAVGARLREAS